MVRAVNKTEDSPGGVYIPAGREQSQMDQMEFELGI